MLVVKQYIYHVLLAQYMTRRMLKGLYYLFNTGFIFNFLTLYNLLFSDEMSQNT